MEISLAMLLYFLHELSPQIVSGPYNEEGFIGLKMFSGDIYAEQNSLSLKFANDNIEQDDWRYLYFGSLKEVWENRSILTDPKITILAVKDKDLTQEELEQLSCTLILFPGDLSASYLVNILVSIFSKLQNWDKSMHISTLEGRSVQSLLEISEELLEYPVIIFDATFEVIASTSQGDFGSENFNQTVQKRYTDPALMNRIRRADVFTRLRPNVPIIVNGIEGENKINICLNFYSNQILLGYACVFCGEDSPEQGYIDMFQLFAENIRLCLERDYKSGRYGEMMYETFLMHLVNPSGFPEGQLAEQMKSIDNLVPEGRFVLGVILFGVEKSVPMQYVARQLEREMYDVKPFLYEGRICLLKTLKDDAPADQSISQWEMNHIDSLLENYVFRMGISKVFHQIEDIRYAYVQANTAMELKGEDSRYCRYDEVYVDHILRTMDREVPLPMFRTELYEQIAEYDRENNTKYLRIILQYLECKCNAVQTAEKLYIHRNSVHNAIRFAEEHWNFQITDPKIEEEMWFSNRIDVYLQEK